MTTKVLPAKEFNHTADYDRHSLFAEVANDVTMTDILRPAFWAHVIPKLKKNARIELIRLDGSLDVDLRVISVGVGYAEVRVLRVWEDPEVASAREQVEDAIEQANNVDVVLPAEYKITTGRGGFVVTFIPNGAKLASGVKTRAAAVVAAREHAAKAGIEWPAAAAPAGAPAQPEPVE